MGRMKTRTNRQHRAVDAVIFESVLNTTGTSSVNFPCAHFCAAILGQAERDYQRCASAFNKRGMENVARDILFPGGLISNILIACNCEPEVYLERLRKQYPLGCDAPMRGRSSLYNASL